MGVDMDTRKEQNTRGFSATLGWFVADVRFEDDAEGRRRYLVSIDLAYRDGPPPGHEPMRFSLSTASEVLDLFEVTAASNGLVESLLLGQHQPAPALRLVKPAEGGAA